MKKRLTLEEGKDYYYNKEGYVVLTENFLRERGPCCHNGCLHCPYNDCFCHKEQEKDEEK